MSKPLSYAQNRWDEVVEGSQEEEWPLLLKLNEDESDSSTEDESSPPPVVESPVKGQVSSSSSTEDESSPPRVHTPASQDQYNDRTDEKDCGASNAPDSQNDEDLDHGMIEEDRRMPYQTWSTGGTPTAVRDFIDLFENPPETLVRELGVSFFQETQRRLADVRESQDRHVSDLYQLVTRHTDLWS